MNRSTKLEIQSEIQGIEDKLSAIRSEVHVDREYVDQVYITEKAGRIKDTLDWIIELAKGE